MPLLKIYMRRSANVVTDGEPTLTWYCFPNFINRLAKKKLKSRFEGRGSRVEGRGSRGEGVEGVEGIFEISLKWDQSIIIRLKLDLLICFSLACSSRTEMLIKRKLRIISRVCDSYIMFGCMYSCKGKLNNTHRIIIILLYISHHHHHSNIPTNNRLITRVRYMGTWHWVFFCSNTLLYKAKRQ